MSNCPEKKDGGPAKPEVSEFKRWQGHKPSGSDNNKRGRKGVSALGCHVRGVAIPVVAAVTGRSPAGTEVEWVLDSASDVHVCNQRATLHNVRVDEVHVFQGYDGEIGENREVGDVTLRVKNNKSPHAEVMLPFKNVLLTPAAPNNLLSMGKLETDGWSVKFSLLDSQQ
ncbi:hypothetical protein PHYSODRAFT_299820 [Phytophthora sojae]|uniref:Retrovirus-related Pol polyprotein from transposon TNT 1-94-like beta-barrel domain-containing protein n=1 Tax=Phytophthora sojae (strain P6497) TaxID=1094619 RepID=G4Z9J9_PHYSP|nr:hypothetical protein PHYSODRAFT_299820 [Phytophthora sojae]EGZ22631.1 hypothetical protein PHYSODRAFT_299820 [Phytophthora sojae]|eukprot:XP_009525348.1 hypothetical protein PHYSODRAFT_299820 [Phytophthora sojae]